MAGGPATAVEKRLPASARATSGSTLVGELAGKEALAFEGLKTFTREQMIEALSASVDFHAAASPSAPLSEYAQTLERLLLSGYQRAGFPEAKISVTSEPQRQRILVTVVEGPRYQCGEIKVAGTGVSTTEELRQKIVKVLIGEGPVSGTEPDSGDARKQPRTLWQPNQPAPFDALARQALTEQVVVVFEAEGYMSPEIEVQVVPVRGRQQADLQVKVVKAPRKGVLANIEVTGALKNSEQEVLNYLGLKPRQPLQGQLVNTVSNRLWSSARFLKHDVTLTPLNKRGQFKLALDLVELEEAPPLNQDFPPEQQAMLKLRDWLVEWPNRPEDLVINSAVTYGKHAVAGQLVLSDSAVVLLVRRAATNQPPELLYAAVTSPATRGLYSPARHCKLTGAPGKTQFRTSLSLLPTGRQKPEKRYHGCFHAGFVSSESLRPFRLDIDLAPVAFAASPADDVVCQLDGDTVTWAHKTTSDSDMRVDLKADAATGRLLHLTILAELDDGEVRTEVRFEQGAFERAMGEIAAATAEHRNVAGDGKPLSSLLAFLAGDALQLARWRLSETGSAQEPAQTLETLAKLDLSKLFTPLEDLWAAVAKGCGCSDEFFIPTEPPQTPASGIAKIMPCLAPIVLRLGDALWPIGSWPWTLPRETVFTLTGKDQYSTAEIDRLIHGGELGPVGCAVGATLLGLVDSKLAEPLSIHGLAKLSPADFVNDVGLLLGRSAPLGGLVTNAISVLHSLKDEDIVSLTEALGLLTKRLSSADLAFLEQCMQLVRGTEDRPPARALAPACEQLWDLVLHPRLLAALDQFLPLSQAAVTPAGQVRRGMLYLTGQGVPQDCGEAAKWFRSAAEQGHARAQFMLAELYNSGQGVPRNFTEAANWYRQAANQDFPHAACELAHLYREGRGVKRDAKEAARWYRLEAERDCASAQFLLGSLLLGESESWRDKWEEALPWFRKAADQDHPDAQHQLGLYHERRGESARALEWFRRAAEHGSVAAQCALGERLSDGLSMTPDYVEAYVWWRAAAAQGDKVAEGDLKRLEKKMIPAQLAEAKERAAQLIKRHSARLPAGERSKQPAKPFAPAKR